MFKQLLQASALQFVQIDSCRVGSVNENLAVMLMAHKFQGKNMRAVIVVIMIMEERVVMVILHLSYSGK